MPDSPPKIGAVADMLALSEDLPEVELAPGDILIQEGGHTDAIWVLVSGSLEIRKGDIVVNTISQPGALLGEVSVLLHSASTATVAAVTTCRLRHAADGEALLNSHPGITRVVAVGLAERLAFVTTYLADLKEQYADAPGMAMVSDVLRELTGRQAPAARSGSAREPNPEY